MLPKIKEHQRAVTLRSKGKSYSEIASSVPVSKSTLSLWLKDVILTKTQIRILFGKKRRGQLKGGFIRKSRREAQQRSIINESFKEIGQISKRDLWIAGIIAYWCEGNKQKEWNVSQQVAFTNSDPLLLKLFLRWLKEYCQIDESSIIYRLHIHESANVSNALKYWSKILGIAISNFSKVSVKKHKVLTNRRNRNSNYHGLVNLTVRQSTNLNRRISGWVLGITDY